MKDSVFRKTALDRLSSPERLDQLLRITSPKAWLMALGLAALALVGGYWAVAGEIECRIAAQGIIARVSGESEATDTGLEVVLYLPWTERQVSNGMEARVSPLFPADGRPVWVMARVISISRLPASRNDILRVTGNETLAESFLVRGPVVEIRARLDQGGSGGKAWPQEGDPCAADIVLSRTKPINLLFPAAGGDQVK
jgi:hypothetical protein